MIARRRAVGKPVTPSLVPSSTATSVSDQPSAWIDHWRAQALSRVESVLAGLMRDTGGLAAPLSHVARTRGKRLRALITLAAASLGLNSPEPPAEAVEAAAGIEALHEASLIHDDIVDQATVRRNDHAVVARFGARTASDTGLCLAGRGLARLAYLCAERGLHVDFGLLRDLALSQILDSLPPASDYPSQYRRQMMATDGKTGTLFVLAIRVGVALARPAVAAYGRDLNAFGSAFGRAFQIRDDILDLEGDPTPSRLEASDLQRGVLSWPLCLWAGMGRDWVEATARLERCRGQLEEAVALRNEVVKHGALDRARALMTMYLDRAGHHLAHLPSSHGRALLVHFVDQLRLE